MTIIEIMDSFKDTYTKTENKIYVHIKENPFIIEEYTISRVALITGTSKSAVLRFCQKMGFSGYSEFRFSFVRELYGQDSLIKSTNSLLENIVDEFKDLTVELNKIQEKKVLKIIETLHDSNLIRSVGIMNSSLPALKLMYDFIKLGKNVITIDSVVLADSSVATIKENDTIIYFSVSGRIDIMKYFVQSAKKRKACIIAVTCNERSDLAKIADDVIVLPKIKTRQNYNVDPHSLMLMFINILTEYYKSNY